MNQAAFYIANREELQGLQEGTALKAGQGCHEPQQRQKELFQESSFYLGDKGYIRRIMLSSWVTKKPMWHTTTLVLTRNFQTDQVTLLSWQRL